MAIRTAILYITERCNQSCVFCLEADGSWNRFVDPSTREVLGLLEALRDRGARNFTFMGGESFFRKDLAGIIGHARRLGPGRIAVATNGTALARPGLVADLVAAGIDCLELSIHGHTATLANRISGASFTFDRQARAMAEINATGGLHTIINLVICRDNRDHLIDVVDYVRGALCAVPLRFKLKFVSLQGRAAAEQLAAEPSAPEPPEPPPAGPPLAYAEVDLGAVGDALAGRGVAFWFYNVPLCRLGAHAGRAHELYTLSVDEQYFDLDHHGPGGYYDSGHQLAGRVWPDPPCPRCTLRPVCPGVEPPYCRVHGTGELAARHDDPLALIAGALAEPEPGDHAGRAAARLAILASAPRPTHHTPAGALRFCHDAEPTPLDLLVEASREDAPAYARVGGFALSYRLRSAADRDPSLRMRSLLSAAVRALEQAVADGVDLEAARRRVALTRAGGWRPALTCDPGAERSAAE